MTSLEAFLLACAAIGIPAALLVWLEYRSRPRDPKSSALRSANRADKGERR